MKEQGTSEQISVIQAPLNAHIKVIAVAGSGKSWSMRRRVLFLLEAGIPAQEILVLMFNKTAQIDFNKKMKKIAPNIILPQARTYHSLGFRLCESLSSKGLLPKFKLITSTSGQALLAKQALKKSLGSLKYGTCNPNRPEIIDAFISYIDLVKSGLEIPEYVFDKAKIDNILSPFIAAYNNFENLRIMRRERFFSDLIYDPVNLILKSTEAREYITNRLQQIIIDEYQDINSISQELIKILSGERAFVTAVGDDDQCLYDWRGSQPEYLATKFDDDFLRPEVFSLTKTFRYGHSISLASNHVVANNKNRVKKLCISSNITPNSTIEMHVEPPTVDGNTPQTAILKSIQIELNQQRSMSDIAILVRLYSMTPPIELALMLAGIPYRIDGRLPVFERQEVSALTNLLRISYNNFFNQTKEFVTKALTDIFLLPHPGVSQTILKSIVETIIESPNNIINIVANAAAELPIFLSSRLNRKADALHTLMVQNDLKPDEALQLFLAMTECEKNIREMSINVEDAEVLIATINAYINFCRSQNSTAEKVIDLIESRKNLQKEINGNKDKILITSVHRAKGLEWSVVILPRLAECYFPYIRDDGKVNIESERRLFYVGMTRAIEKLVLIIPPDEGLVSSLALNSSSVPPEVYKNSKRASRFIYEANLKMSIEIGQKIFSSESYCDVETAENPVIINQYLSKVGSQFRISQITKY